MSFDIWITFVLASSLLLMIPGPTILLVISYALNHGRGVALAAATGVSLGDFIAMTASLLGLGAIILASATLFTLLKWVGAAYLVYLGIKLFRSAAKSEPININQIASSVKHSAKSTLVHTAMVTALNPKSIVFFIAFVPQFISMESPLLPQYMIMIATFVGLSALNALAFVFLADRLRRQIRKTNVLKFINRLGGTALVTMGAATLMYRRAVS